MKRHPTQNKIQYKRGPQKDSISDSTCRIEFASSLALNSFARRFALALFFFVIGTYSVRNVLVQNSGMTEVDLLNDMIERSKLVYANSLSYSRQDRNPNIRPGYVLRQQGATALYPVVMVPGFITSGLELWDGEECAKSYYRQRLWGSLPVFMQSFFTDNECWRQHLSLDPNTGKDPQNIRLRSAQGFEAADYIMSTFWVWGPMIDNLADLGYDASNMMMMPYDWRLSFVALEERDGYLTKLRFNIEAMVKTSGRKVVLTSHSMGSQIVLFFFQWVTTSEEDGGGGAGKDWVENNIHSFVNIAGPVLGVPKAVAALLSGEMKDTAAIMGTMGVILERVFGRRNRKELWKTWGSLWAMLPKGGDAIWSNAGDIIKHSTSNEGNTCFAVFEENTCSAVTAITTDDPFISFDKAVGDKNNGKDTWTVDDSIKYLQHWGNELKNSAHAAKVHSFQTQVGHVSVENWHDPTVTPLPDAPSMKMYCLYGVGIETERAYSYKQSLEKSDQTLGESSSVEDFDFLMDTTINDPINNIKLGTRFSDGDVSVPLVSLGFMCVDGWKDNKRLNPSEVSITTREYLDREEFRVNDPMRKGPHSADHVDILGNVETILDLLQIVTDFEVSTVNKDKIVSEIESISNRIVSRIDFKSEIQGGVL
jgi:phospholipid:diacylglycerol acyltransferase